MVFKSKNLINFQTLIFCCFFGLFLFVLFLTEKYSQSFHFVDEEEHLVTASFMNKGYHLYTDLSSNHQPFVYIISSLAQKITHPDNLFSLIKTGREIVFFYSLIFSFLLFLNFGPRYLIFALFFELTKFFIFGNLLLAESLVVYPLIFIIGESFKLVFYSYQPKKWQSFVFGLANFLIIFNLFPLIPSLLFFDLIYLIKTKKTKHFFIGILLPIAVLFLFIPPVIWFKETVFYNLKYAIPEISPIKSYKDYLNLLIFPILSFVKGRISILNQFIQLFSFILFLNFVIFLTLKKKKKLIAWILLFFSILLLNNRVLIPGEMFYTGFHLLPWYAGFIFFNLLTIELIFKEIKGARKFFPLLILVIGGVFLFSRPQMPYFVKINKDYEHNVNFFPYFLIGEAIKRVSQPKDRLAILPDESLIYWQSGLRPATRQIVYYEWEYWVPELRQQMDEAFTNNPPEFIYTDSKRIGSASYLPILNSALEKNYWQVTSQGIAQNLFIKKQKIREITNEQWEEWRKLSFDKIEL